MPRPNYGKSTLFLHVRSLIEASPIIFITSSLRSFGDMELGLIDCQNTTGLPMSLHAPQTGANGESAGLYYAKHAASCLVPSGFCTYTALCNADTCKYVALRYEKGRVMARFAFSKHKVLQRMVGLGIISSNRCHVDI